MAFMEVFFTLIFMEVFFMLLDTAFWEVLLWAVLFMESLHSEEKSYRYHYIEL
jgi:hypothetical protein